MRVPPARVPGWHVKKILIANRGEIAVRIARTCRDMGLATVAVYSDCDRGALHVRVMDEAHPLGPNPSSESYLRIDKLIDAARRSGADAVHPGYGFLAENGEFADACRRAQLTFIGPTAQAMAKMGSKTSARQVALDAGVPVVPGTEAPFGDAASEDEIARAAEGVGYPLLVKAVAGGGGKGMRVVRSPEALAAAARAARSEARASFGNAAIYLERLLDRPRHVEVQLLGDHHGTVLPFVERECSIQRRHQKLVEETPSGAVGPALRAELARAAERIARAAGYTSAGTIEFLLDEAGRHYFLEMNTRLQVEHPVTEAVTGVDFVRAQIEIARGERLQLDPARMLSPDGHAIECRIYAEDPDQGFLPSPGRITHLRAPSGPGVRDDSGATAGWDVPTYYDPLISKVIAWGPDRSAARSRMSRALAEYDLRGIRTTIGFCRWVMGSSDFAEGRFDTTWVDTLLERDPVRAAASSESEEIAALAAALYVHHVQARTQVEGTSESLWTRHARVEALRDFEGGSIPRPWPGA